MIILDTAYKIGRALEVYIKNPAGLRQAQAAAILLFHSKKLGWRRAQGFYQRAGQLLDRLRNRSTIYVVQSE